MIKFFRKIRQKKLMDNKFSKYLLYAIGEIILVVIGILIALQINNWNQARIENNEERIALLNLKQDFDFNYETLDGFITQTESTKTSQLIILNHTGNKPKPKKEEEFNILLNRSLGLKEYFPRNGSLDELLSSGKLRIIKNQRLRKFLSSWHPLFGNIKTREKTVLRDIYKINEYTLTKASWLNVDAVVGTSPSKNNSYPKSGFKIDNRSLLNELEFENMIENASYQNDLLINQQKIGLELVKEIIELIEKEIKE
jgi:hypothetical protein